MRTKMTNKEMLETVNRIVDMQNREDTKQEKIFGSKIKALYAIKKNKDKLIQLLKPYDESRKELLEECNKTEAQLNNQIDIKNDCKEKWKKNMDELMEIEVDVDIHTIKFSELEGLNLSINDFEAIEFMLEDPEGSAE